MNPDIDRKLYGPPRSIDIQKEAVLVFFCSQRRPSRNVASCCQCLKAGGPKGVRSHGLASVFWLSRRAETEVPNRRSSVTNASPRLAANQICLNQRNSPFPYVQIRAVIVKTCVCLVSEVNRKLSRMGVAKQGETCYQDCFDAHIRSCHLGDFWLNRL